MKPLLFSTLLAVLILAAVEATLRAIHPEKLDNANFRGEVAYEFDPDYLMRLKKNMVKRYYRAPRNGGRKIVWSSNSQGFRGGELRLSARPRIVVYGDSNIQARFSEEQDTYPQKLRQYLAADLPDVEVINAGVIGFGPDQALIKFLKEIPLLQPDVAIFNIFCDNDYGDLIRNRLFEIGPDGQFVPTTLPREPDDYLRYHLAQRKRFQSLIAMEGRAFINRLFGEKEDPLKKEKMMAALEELNAQEFDVYRWGLPRSASHFRDHYDLDLALDPEGPAARAKIRLMAGVLKEVKLAGAAHGVRVIVQIQPAAIDLTQNHIISYKDLQAYPAYDRRRLTRIVEEICREIDLEYFNLYDVFSAEAPESYYFQHDDHWNDRGQAVAAAGMAIHLQQQE